MIIFISSAKTLSFKNLISLDFKPKNSVPIFAASSLLLSDYFKKMNLSEIKKIMKVSDSIAEKTLTYFNKNNEELNLEKSAIELYNGEVYRQLERNTYNLQENEFIQSHLYIISGLYGVLRPFDDIEPYRLEMNTPITIESYKNLYEFWGQKVSKYLSQNVEPSSVILNLASKEYFRIIIPEILSRKIVHVNFKKSSDFGLLNIGTQIKHLRGKLLNYLVKNKITDIELVKEFSIDGYLFNKSLSNEQNLVFSKKGKISCKK